MSDFDDDFDPHNLPKDFQKRSFTEESFILRKKVSELITLLELGEVPRDLIEKLNDAVKVYVTSGEDFDSEFNLREELATQLRMVRAVRSSILNANGHVKEDTTVSEVKSVLDASMRLAQILSKANKEIVNIERLQAVEAAFLEVISSFDDDRQKEFVEVLEKRMKAQKALVNDKV